MLILWIFWMEILTFCAYAIWTLLSAAGSEPLTGYQWADLVVYSAALIYGLYGFVQFVRRRLALMSS